VVRVALDDAGAGRRRSARGGRCGTRVQTQLEWGVESYLVGFENLSHSVLLLPSGVGPVSSAIIDGMGIVVVSNGLGRLVFVAFDIGFGFGFLAVFVGRVLSLLAFLSALGRGDARDCL
jgi:hypothetical protein